MRTLSLAIITAALAVPSVAYAQEPNAGGAVGGAVIGGVVGGPVGAVVGAIAGSTLPQEPSVVYHGPIAVGEELPGTITVYPVPRHREYRYAVVDNQRVIVDRHRRIVRVMP